MALARTALQAAKVSVALMALALSNSANANPDAMFEHPAEKRKEISAKCHDLVGGVANRSVRRRFWESCLSLEICKAAIGDEKCERRARILGSARDARQINHQRELICLAAKNFEECLNRDPDDLPYIGVKFRRSGWPDVNRHKLKKYDSYSVVEAVKPGGPADGVLKPDDMLLAINDTSFVDNWPYRFWPKFRKTFAPGEVVTFKFLRDGDTVEAKITLGTYVRKKRNIGRRPGIGSGGWRFMQ